ncbi:MAG: hypothetical protein DRI32_00510 [Chloroflexi bacterium]|nr:MAG: hypothetical protein DRI32_00510 [Chloroflexota bacterium]
MNKEDRLFNYLDNQLKHWKGKYIVYIEWVVIALSAPASLSALFYISLNISLTSEANMLLIRSLIITLIIADIISIGIMQLQTRSARKLLNLQGNKSQYTRDATLELQAWKEITALPWRFSVITLIATITLIIAPIELYMLNIVGISNNEGIHLAIGGLLAGIIVVTIYTILLNVLLLPARQALQPESFEDHVAGLSGLKIRTSLRVLSITTIAITLLTIAPRSYQEAVNAMNAAGFGEGAVIQLRVQLATVAISAFIIGVILADSLSRTLYRPIERLRQVMEKVSLGDLNQRATLISTDEIGELAIYFNAMVSRLDNLQSGLEQVITKRTEQLKATAEVGRVVSSILKSDELMEKVVGLITERLGYYYAAIFIISPDGYWAELKSATGTAGETLKEKKHRLSLSGKSMVGSAISLREARIAHDVGKEATRFNNPLLPHTRSEIALPLIVGGHVLGALDAQSTEENAFDEEVTETLQGMANQVAIALENARLFQETQETLKEIRINQKTQLSTAWTEALDTQGNLEFSTGEKASSEKPALNVPLALRDQIIGEITLENDAGWTREDQGWVEAVATQAALALENARLLEESQRIALQERLIAEITGKIWSSSTTDGILKIAVKELGSALGASEAIIQLDIDDQQEI